MTTSRRFCQVDVFTTRPYSGNPVAVVLDAQGLDPEAMQRFARWTNLSETTFVLPASGPADYRLRIFTPSQELPFAGHPTLGSCHAWLESGGAPAGEVIVQECAAGLVRVRRTEKGLAFASPPLVRSGEVADTVVQQAADELRIDRADIHDAQWVDNGPGWVAVLLESAEAVLALRPGPVELKLGVVGPCPPGSAEQVEVRAFFPGLGGASEDPVTGSLNASLAGWLPSTGVVQLPYVARQGTALGRGGRVHLSADEDGQVWAAGGTVTCISGHVELG